MFEQMLKQLGPWLHGEGPESDIVISSRIRLARNVSGYPFISKASEQNRQQVEEVVYRAVKNVHENGDLFEVDLEPLSPLERQMLVERQLISREIADTAGPRAVYIANDESYSIMVNEEDHLRMQAVTSGLDLHKVWDRINTLDDHLEMYIPYSFSEELGYLTACPTNVGTGMRVSVMLHLPAVSISQEIDKVFRGLQKLNLAVRGIYGEGSQALGEFYQISNQITLGRSEIELIQQVQEIVERIVQYERKARETILASEEETLLDKASRAIGLLQTARTMSSEEAMHLLSTVRLGVNTGLLQEPGIPMINELLLHTQPGHLQRLMGTELSPVERDLARAQYLRKRLGHH
ncbi:MAG: protein arginine kinase [Planctomycetaceae bacterium]|nr:protein arginine kinase [Planctomycetaceae bacterium]